MIADADWVALGTHAVELLDAASFTGVPRPARGILERRFSPPSKTKAETSGFPSSDPSTRAESSGDGDVRVVIFIGHGGLGGKSAESSER